MLPLWHKILDVSFLRLLTTQSVTSDDDHFDWNVMTPSRSFQVSLNISLHSKNQFHHLSSIFKNIRVRFIFRFFEANFCHFLLQNFRLRAAKKNSVGGKSSKFCWCWIFRWRRCLWFFSGFCQWPHYCVVMGSNPGKCLKRWFTKVRFYFNFPKIWSK